MREVSVLAFFQRRSTQEQLGGSAVLASGYPGINMSMQLARPIVIALQHSENMRYSEMVAIRGDEVGE